jgi:hypothetical protein
MLLGVAFIPSSVLAQQPQTLRQQTVGVWSVTANTLPQLIPVVGTTPKGYLFFAGSGKFAIVLENNDRPKGSARGDGMFASFGTWSVDEGAKTRTTHTEGAMDSSIEGTDRKVNMHGQRFVSPDGTAWFEWYRVAAGDKSVAAHMKSVAFADGEELTQVRGQRNWISVSGFRGDRIFYRQALLACAGDRWHHIAFEYPSSAKGSMTDFVRRAAQALETTQNAGCDIPVSSAE